MSRARMYRLALEKVQREQAKIVDPDPMTQEELDEAIDDVLSIWEEDAARDREMFGEPVDTDCIEDGRDNCNDWGTGEGRFHGRIG